MTDTKKDRARATPHNTIWRITNEMRGSVYSWDFKQYMFGLLFYRFISENSSSYVNKKEKEAGDHSFNYADLDDKEAERGRAETVKEKGFFIQPSELFENVRKRATGDASLSETLKTVFKNIEASAQGTASESSISGVFDVLDVNSNKLGATAEARNEKLVKLLNAIGDLSMGSYDDNSIDLFGDIYESLMTRCAANALKTGGDFFTPKEVSELLARITVVGKKEVNKVYDPVCGSGSLLLKFAKVLGKDNVRNGFFGQEINTTTYNLCRINMFLHGINHEQFDIAHGDTLTAPCYTDDEPFDAIVSHPPYSINWEGDENPKLIKDDRFTPAGVLAPKSKADFAFVMHALSRLATNGTAAIVSFPGALYRGGTEQKIRKYLVDSNHVDAVIQLPSGVLFGSSIAACILVLKKNKPDRKVLFIDASNEFAPEDLVRGSAKNRLNDEHIKRILDCYANRETHDHFSSLVDHKEIADKDYNISVAAHVIPKSDCEDIAELNKEIEGMVKVQSKLRNQVDDFVADLEVRQK